MKITVTKNLIENAPKKYCRLVITEDAPNWHRLVETPDGQLKYRMGAGKYRDMTARKFRLFVRSIVQAAKSHQLENVAMTLPEFPKLKDTGEEWVYSTVAENLHLAAYEFTAYKSKQSKKGLKEILLCGGISKKAESGFKRGEIVAEATNNARDIANTPALDMTPDLLAKAAKKAIAGTKATIKVLSHTELKKLKMGALLAVGQGAENDPKLIVIEYYGLKKPGASSKKDSSLKPIVLLGKGITYDTGGLNVKPSGAMHEMHLDMSGGAMVIGAISAIAKMKLKKNVIAIIPTAENAVSDKAMRAGDIVTSMSGQTIEVTHTDAEGRMVLADALTYSERFNPKVVLDIATLTGASLVALGQHTSAIMTKDEKLQTKLIEIGEESGDYMWPLPLWDEYKPYVKSARADISNISPSFSKYGGAIEGGIFLSFFAPKNAPWAHIDMAPRMTSVPSDKLAKGATGEPVRMLVKFVEQY